MNFLVHFCSPKNGRKKGATIPNSFERILYQNVGGMSRPFFVRHGMLE